MEFDYGLMVASSYVGMNQNKMVTPINVLAFTWQFYHRETNAGIYKNI